MKCSNQRIYHSHIWYFVWTWIPARYLNQIHLKVACGLHFRLFLHNVKCLKSSILPCYFICTQCNIKFSASACFLYIQVKMHVACFLDALHVLLVILSSCSGCQSSRKESDCYLHHLQLEVSEQNGQFTLQAFNAIFIFHLLKLSSGTVSWKKVWEIYIARIQVYIQFWFAQT
jgi:hypothetical protein